MCEAFLMTLLFSVLAGFLYDFARKYLVSRLSILLLFFSLFFLRRFEDKRSSESVADSGFEVRRQGFFVVLLKLRGPLMSDMFLLPVQTLGCV